MVDYWRQMDLIPIEQLAVPITVIGAGGIGSFAILALAKMGCQKITVYDPDLVEAHNVPNQLFRTGDIGKAKVKAIEELVEELTGIKVTGRQDRVERQNLSGIVVSCVDSMAARTAIWQNCVRFKAGIPLYLEARMGAEVLRLYGIHPFDPDEVRYYESTLYGDEAALEEKCTARSIIYTPFISGGFLAAQVKKFVTAEDIKREVIFDFTTWMLMTDPPF